MIEEPRASICLIGLNYAPEPIGIGPFSEGLATHLAERGYNVQVISGVPYYPDWQLHEGYSNRVATSHEGGVSVTRVPHYIPANPTGGKRLRHHASFAVNAARAANRIAKRFSPAAVIAIAPSLISAPVALRMARTCRAASWLHIQDFEVEAALATGLLPGFAGAIGKRFERSVIARFDHVSTIAPRMVEKALLKGAAPGSVYEFRNWADPAVGHASDDPARVRKELSLPAGAIALYSGNLARKQGIGVILEAAERLQGRGDLHFVVCGSGPSAPEVERAAAILPNVSFRPLQDRRRLPDLLAMADIHLLPQIAGAADLVLPSKLANMLASGRPVIATADRGTSLAAEVEGCGVVVDAGDAAGFAEAIARLLDDPEERRRLGRNASARAQERWSRAAVLDRFSDTIELAIEERVR